MRSLSQRHRVARRSGFTLLELLIVLGIIVALAAMVAPNLIGSAQDANIQTTRATIKNIEDACKRKAIKMNNVYDSGSGPEVIRKLAEPYEDSMGKQQQPVLESVPLDAWNNEFQYAYDPGTDLKPRIWSFGPDGEDGGGQNNTDDVSNLPREIQ
ncbi:MAG: type II secretion system protein GspG [Planctomycetaceae bacterium]